MIAPHRPRRAVGHSIKLSVDRSALGPAVSVFGSSCGAIADGEHDQALLVQVIEVATGADRYRNVHCDHQDHKVIRVRGITHSVTQCTVVVCGRTTRCRDR